MRRFVSAASGESSAVLLPPARRRARRSSRSLLTRSRCLHASASRTRRQRWEHARAANGSALASASPLGGLTQRVLLGEGTLVGDPLGRGAARTELRPAL